MTQQSIVVSKSALDTIIDNLRFSRQICREYLQQAKTDTGRAYWQKEIGDITKALIEIDEQPEPQPGYETWSEPATVDNAPEHPGEPSDDPDAYIAEQERIADEVADGYEEEAEYRALVESGAPVRYL